MVTVSEYTTKKLDTVCDLVGLHKYLCRHKLGAALTINPDGTITSKSYVGAIRYKNVQIEVQPKLLHYNNAMDKNTVLSNLTYMLSYTRKLDIKTTEDVKLNYAKNPFLEILIGVYASSLFEALKKQTPKAYVTQEENLCYMKGKLKIAENIRHNVANAAKFYCAYDEFSEDNPLNRLFRFVSTLLSKITANNRNRKMLQLIQNHYADVRLMPMSYVMAQKIILMRNQSIFAKPLKLAQMFLQYASVDFANNKIESMALLWDMNKLFEEFVYELLRRKCNENYRLKPQKKHNIFYSKGEHYSKADILVENVDAEPLMVIDTKYKKISGIKDVSTDDIYQVATYCLLYRTHKAMLLYPQWISTVNNEPPQKLDIDVGDYFIYFRTLDLQRDLRDKEVEEKIVKELNQFLKDME